jgi:hypothetical protein
VGSYEQDIYDFVDSQLQNGKRVGVICRSLGAILEIKLLHGRHRRADGLISVLATDGWNYLLDPADLAGAQFEA